jgi:hypothetical protein
MQQASRCTEHVACVPMQEHVQLIVPQIVKTKDYVEQQHRGVQVCVASSRETEQELAHVRCHVTDWLQQRQLAAGRQQHQWMRQSASRWPMAQHG